MSGEVSSLQEHMENTFWTAFGASLSAAVVTSEDIYVISLIDQPLL